jgi:hypothetical protein
MKTKIELLIFIVIIPRINFSMEGITSDTAPAQAQHQEHSAISCRNGIWHIRPMDLTGQDFPERSLGSFLQQQRCHVSVVTTCQMQKSGLQDSTLLHEAICENAQGLISGRFAAVLLLPHYEYEQQDVDARKEALIRARENILEVSRLLETSLETVTHERDQERQAKEIAQRERDQERGAKDRFELEKNNLHDQLSKTINQKNAALIGLGGILGALSIQWLFRWVKARFYR